MASRSLDDLTPEFRQLAISHKKLCLDKGVDLLIYCTLRDEEEQARIFRQNRTTSAIKKKIQQLKDMGFPKLAHILEDTPPQPNVGTALLTYFGPGESAHQHGVAYDCVPLVSGKPVWDTNTKVAKDLWKIVKGVAAEIGLETLKFEHVHFQVKNFDLIKHKLMAEAYR